MDDEHGSLGELRIVARRLAMKAAELDDLSGERSRLLVELAGRGLSIDELADAAATSYALVRTLLADADRSDRPGHAAAPRDIHA